MALALQEDQPSAISDPVARLQTYFDRLTLAMQVAEDEDHREEAFQLILLAAQAARADQAVAAIVRARPDLAMRFGDRRAVAEIYEATDREPWRGRCTFGRLRSTRSAMIAAGPKNNYASPGPG